MRITPDSHFKGIKPISLYSSFKMKHHGIMFWVDTAFKGQTI